MAVEINGSSSWSRYRCRTRPRRGRRYLAEEGVEVRPGSPTAATLTVKAGDGFAGWVNGLEAGEAERCGRTPPAGAGEAPPVPSVTSSPSDLRRGRRGLLVVEVEFPSEAAAEAFVVRRGSARSPAGGRTQSGETLTVIAAADVPQGNM
jgi:hypothetical protein